MISGVGEYIFGTVKVSSSQVLIRGSPDLWASTGRGAVEEERGW